MEEVQLGRKCCRLSWRSLRRRLFNFLPRGDEFIWREFSLHSTSRYVKGCYHRRWRSIAWEEERERTIQSARRSSAVLFLHPYQQRRLGRESQHNEASFSHFKIIMERNVEFLAKQKNRTDFVGRLELILAFLPLSFLCSTSTPLTLPQTIQSYSKCES